ncbi:DUF1045 domain-containing protein [Ancylobacter sp. 6x-1]|uniref:DUF1045 domain-containing protein n=1 Tax=Ancylobacter crimeensis TaxID=2579147 RepID=A0ABT0DD67_9HYPH|nr:DUF1045 domain-containing protein [Ancylobacter crimeensis]MCK0197903.1 DUF1045 domain-containing protein [Ancylobacter crimeensis]
MSEALPVSIRAAEAGPSASRYAVYYAPAAARPLWRFGSRVIGYDAETGEDLESPPLRHFDAESWRAVTADPRRYGFHGTLKAPFRLAPGHDEAGLRASCARFAASRPRFACAGVAVSSIGRFLALRTVQPCAGIDRLAAGAVSAFDAFRAPLNEAEMEKRLRAPLTERQRDYLARWGYPYVMDEFRFHMTLTGAMDEATRSRAEDELRALFAESEADGPLIVAEIALYRQEAKPGARFRLIERFPLGA